jgi:hypothetical protein
VKFAGDVDSVHEEACRVTERDEASAMC